MKKETLEYLAQRLEAVAKGDFLEAAVLVRKVLASSSPALQQAEAEYALYSAVWDQITQAIARKDYDPASEEQVYALEAEMHGKILKHQLASTRYRGVEDLLRSSEEHGTPDAFEISDNGAAASFWCCVFLVAAGIPSGLVFFYEQESMFWPLRFPLLGLAGTALLGLFMIELKHRADRNHYNSQRKPTARSRGLSR